MQKVKHSNQYAIHVIILFSHVGRFHDPGICQSYSIGPST